MPWARDAPRTVPAREQRNRPAVSFTTLTGAPCGPVFVFFRNVNPRLAGGGGGGALNAPTFYAEL